MGRRGLERARAVAAGLPDAMAAAGFECRLAPGTSQVDLGTRVDAVGHGPGVLAGLGDELGLGWRRLGEFARAWAAPGSELRRTVPFLFLELDLAGAEPEPSVFLRIESGEPLGVIATALSLLVGGASLPRVEIERCVEALPEGGRILHAGAMLGRPGSPIRLYASLSFGAVRGYLEGVGLDAVAEHARAAAERHAFDGAPIGVQFDVGPSGRPRVGVELWAPGDTRERRSGEWRALVERLVADGLCDPVKGDELLAWPRARVSRKRPLALVLDVSHVKVVCTPEGAVEAKAYVFATPLRLEARRQDSHPARRVGDALGTQVGVGVGD